MSRFLHATAYKEQNYSLFMFHGRVAYLNDGVSRKKYVVYYYSIYNTRFICSWPSTNPTTQAIGVSSPAISSWSDSSHGYRIWYLLNLRFLQFFFPAFRGLGLCEWACLPVCSVFCSFLSGKAVRIRRWSVSGIYFLIS